MPEHQRSPDALRVAKEAVAANPRWYHTIDLAPGLSTPGQYDLRPTVDRIPWPDLAGKRCLDIGTYDGFFAFEMERRGAAEVVATDLKEHEEWDLPDAERSSSLEGMRRWGEKGSGFLIAKEALGSAVRREWMNVYDLSPERIGMFDVVFCGSLLLHLSDPVGALRAIHSVTKGTFISAEAIDLKMTLLHPRRAVFKFMGTARFRQWFVANQLGHEQLLESVGFRIEATSDRYVVPFGPTHPKLPTGWRTSAREVLERRMAGGTGVPHRAIRVGV